MDVVAAVDDDFGVEKEDKTDDDDDRDNGKDFGNCRRVCRCTLAWY